MNKQEILKKAEGIIEENIKRRRKTNNGKDDPKYIATCLKASVCPNCGSIIRDTVADYADVYLTCDNCNSVFKLQFESLF